MPRRLDLACAMSRAGSFECVRSSVAIRSHSSRLAKKAGAKWKKNIENSSKMAELVPTTKRRTGCSRRWSSQSFGSARRRGGRGGRGRGRRRATPTGAGWAAANSRGWLRPRPGPSHLHQRSLVTLASTTDDRNATESPRIYPSARRCWPAWSAAPSPSGPAPSWSSSWSAAPVTVATESGRHSAGRHVSNGDPTDKNLGTACHLSSERDQGGLSA